MKQTGQVKYDEIAAAVYPGACEVKLAEGTQALNSGDYAGAIDPLSKVVLMNEGYNDGQALLNLAQAYKGSGDNENATVYFQKVIEKYAGSESLILKIQILWIVPVSELLWGDIKRFL
mgnify:CR=1 FL=1